MVSESTFTGRSTGAGGAAAAAAGAGGAGTGGAAVIAAAAAGLAGRVKRSSPSGALASIVSNVIVDRFGLPYTLLVLEKGRYQPLTCL